MKDGLIAVAGMTQRKSTQFNMRMDPELKAAAEKAAADDDARSRAGSSGC